jgi:cell division protein FtsB
MIERGRLLTGVLLLMIAVLTYSLTLGKGGWLRIHSLDQEISTQKETNIQMQGRNQALSAEVQDLKKGSDALEERARVDLGMVRQGETYYRFVEPPPKATP